VAPVAGKLGAHQPGGLEPLDHIEPSVGVRLTLTMAPFGCPDHTRRVQ
jgi:hypothetical protein